MPLETSFVELGVIEGAEDWSQPAHRPDELKRWRDNVDLQVGPQLAHEVEPCLGLDLHIAEGVACGDEIKDLDGAAIAGKRAVAKSFGRVECALGQAAAA